jgi:hypothetical protein
MMKCCPKCFSSNYLNQIIINNREMGNCDFCLSENVNIYNPAELNLFFQNILDLYEISENGNQIEDQVIKDFDGKVFTEKLILAKATKNLLLEIVKDDLNNYSELFENPVQLKFINFNFEEVIIKPLELSWSKFSDEIKHINRFHLNNNLDLDKLKSLFKHFAKDLPKGKKFNRARICESTKGFLPKEMGNPPIEKAKSGRANPMGISYLYLGSDLETTLYEARASLFDFVCVGEFRLEENIQVINLSKNTYDPFILAENDSLEEVMMHSQFIEKLNQELSKPRRRNDSELDYLPTQYLSELIKSMGYAGIEYQSSLYSSGYNLAIFTPKIFKCINVKVYDIEEITLKSKVIRV